MHPGEGKAHTFVPAPADPDIAGQPAVFDAQGGGCRVPGFRLLPRSGYAVPLACDAFNVDVGLQEQRAADAFRKSPEALVKRCHVAVYIEVVGVGARDRCMGGMEVQKAPVKFVRLDHGPFGIRRPHGVRLHSHQDAADESPTSRRLTVHQMGKQSRSRGLAVGAGYGQGGRVFGEPAEYLAALAHAAAAFAGANQHGKIVGDSRRSNDKGALVGHFVQPAIEMRQSLGLGCSCADGHAGGLQLCDELRIRPVVPGHGHPLGMEVACNGAHANAADSDEVRV